jgi:glycosyltransferase involved in cell wall biosynthesis
MRKTPSNDVAFPVKLLEYAAMAIPVIATRTTMLERAFDERSLRLVEPGDAEALAAAIIELLRHPERRRVMSRELKKRCSELRPEDLADRYRALVAALCPPHDEKNRLK